MTQNIDIDVSENVEVKKRFGTKAKAILAGGLVLGVGAAITLAAWTDTEWAIGNFSAGTFAIEGSTDGADWDDHPVEGAPASLSFTIGADKLSPGDSVYALYGVQLKAGTTNKAEVTVVQDNSDAQTGVSAQYSYVTTASCSTETDFTEGENLNAPNFDLTSVEAPTYICIKATAAPTLVQGSNGSITWTFTASSLAAI